MSETPRRRTGLIIVGVIALIGLLCIGTSLAIYVGYQLMQPAPTHTSRLDDADDRVDAYLDNRPNPPSVPRDVYFSIHVPETYHGTPVEPGWSHAALRVEPADATLWGASCEPLADEDWPRFNQQGALGLMPSPDAFGPLQSIPIVKQCSPERFYVIYEPEGVVLDFDVPDFLTPLVLEGEVPEMPLPVR